MWDSNADEVLEGEGLRLYETSATQTKSERSERFSFVPAVTPVKNSPDVVNRDLRWRYSGYSGTLHFGMETMWPL